jgi:hypothetical protein
MTSAERVLHDMDQVRAWKPADMEAFVGRWIAILSPDDDLAFWADPSGYAGTWFTLGEGVVKSASMDDERMQVEFTDGAWLRWVVGEPINVMAEVPS